MQYTHHIHESGKGGITIAWDVISHNQGKTLRYAVAQCSKKDTYCRRKGRDQAVLNYVNNINISTLVVKGGIKTTKRRVQEAMKTLAYTLNHMQQG